MLERVTHPAAGRFNSACVLVWWAVASLPIPGRAAITQIIDATGDGAGNVLDNPGEIAVDTGGNVFVAAAFTSNAFEIKPGGRVTQIIDTTGDGAGNGLLIPFGIAVGPTGNVYVSGHLSHNAFGITPSPHFVPVLGTAGRLAVAVLLLATGVLSMRGRLRFQT